MYAASYRCVSASNAALRYWGLKLLVYAALKVPANAASSLRAFRYWGLKLLVYAALRYLQTQPPR